MLNPSVLFPTAVGGKTSFVLELSYQSVKSSGAPPECLTEPGRSALHLVTKLWLFEL